MSAVSRVCVALLATGMVAGGAVFAAPTAEAADPIWNGRYAMVGYAAEKSGTSLAAGQYEPDFRDEYVFATRCSADACVATVVDGLRPNNPTIPLPTQYIWDGTRWVDIFDWVWDCFMGEGVPQEWSPARSWAYYVPQPDGTLRGT